MKEKIVTIITLSYNKFDRLYETIKSVLNQNYSKIQYIIADDGSKAFPEKDIIKYIEYNKKNNLVSYIVSHSNINQGTVKNIKRILDEISGKYVMHLSCNDVFYNDDVVSKVVNRFEEKNAEVIVTSRLLYKNNFEPMFYLPHIKERKIIEGFDTPYKQYKAIVTDQFYDMASGSAMYFRNTDLFKEIYADERFFLWEDGPFLEKYLWGNKLEFAYDIVSILYQWGGVSNLSFNSNMHNDLLIFNNEDRINHFNELDFFSKRKVKYYIYMYKCKGNFMKIIYLLKYPDVFFSNVLYKFKRKKAKLYDTKFFKNKITM